MYKKQRIMKLIKIALIILAAIVGLSLIGQLIYIVLALGFYFLFFYNPNKHK